MVTSISGFSIPTPDPPADSLFIEHLREPFAHSIGFAVTLAVVRLPIQCTFEAPQSWTFPRLAGCLHDYQSLDFLMGEGWHARQRASKEQRIRADKNLQKKSLCPERVGLAGFENSDDQNYLDALLGSTVGLKQMTRDFDEPVPTNAVVQIVLLFVCKLVL